MSCGADSAGKIALANITQGLNFDFQDIDMSGGQYEIPGGTANPMFEFVKRVTNEDLTERKVDGEGTFDYLMKGTSVWLDREYKSGRITAAEFSKTWIAMTEACIAGAVQFQLGKDQAYWSGVNAQVAAIRGNVDLAVAKMEFAAKKGEALTNKARYGLTIMQMATEDINYCQGKFTHENILPKNASLLTEQINGQKEQTKLLTEQQGLVKEQKEAQRGQTSDTRTDGQPVMGVLGKQKDLYTQQIESYKRDSELKAAKMWTDAWITQKTIDEAVLAPNMFTNATVDQVLGSIKTKNGL